MRGKKTGKQQHQQQKTTVPRPFPHRAGGHELKQARKFNSEGQETPLALTFTPNMEGRSVACSVSAFFCVCVSLVVTYLGTYLPTSLLFARGQFWSRASLNLFQTFPAWPSHVKRASEDKCAKENFPWSWEWKKEPRDVDLEETTQLLGAGYNWT